MDGDGKRNRTKTFLLGGLVGASAVLAAAKRRRSATPLSPRRGLSAFDNRHRIVVSGIGRNVFERDDGSLDRTGECRCSERRGV